MTGTHMGVLLRLLLLATLFWLLAAWLRRWLAPPPPANPPMTPARLQPCSYCQTHVPETDCTRSQGLYFCCEAHRDAYLNRKP